MSMSIEKRVNQCWRMLKQYCVINVHQKTTRDTVQLFYITSDVSIGNKGDMSLHMKQLRSHIISIKNEQGISPLPH